MGLEEHIKAGAQLTRNSIVTTLPSGSGSINLGSTFSILSIKVDAPLRLRLYDTEESRDDVIEVNRPFGQFPATSSISLIGDFSMSAAGTYTIAPAVFGISTNRNTPQTYYRIETPIGGATQVIITINRYLLEDKSIEPSPNTFYVTDNRRVLEITGSSIYGTNGFMGVNEIVSGTLSFPAQNIPQTFLLISASVTGSLISASSADLQQVRLRLYATSSALLDLTEASRSFSTEPAESTMLLVDAIISGSDTLYFSPKMFAANIENMGEDLEVTKLTLAKLSGKNEVYYFLQNLSGIPAQTPQVALSVYSLED